MKGYETLSLAGLLEENSYPGRGIVLGMTGACALMLLVSLASAVKAVTP